MANVYKYIYAPEHPFTNTRGYICEHIIVAEKMIGRALKEEEVVHHIDKNRSNNNPENLMVFATNADHTCFHKGGIPYKDGDVWRCIRVGIKTKRCLYCGNEFQTKENRKKYCSFECAVKDRCKLRYTADMIQAALIEFDGNFTKAAKEFNVSANALVKMLKKNNLPYHSKDYRN